MDMRRDSVNPFAQLPATENEQENSSYPRKNNWKIVSTRRWARNFRSYINNYQSRGNRLCGNWFWSFGYYPDLVPEATLLNYMARYPVPLNKHEAGSDEDERAFRKSMYSRKSRSSVVSRMSIVSGPGRDYNANYSEGVTVGDAADAAFEEKLRRRKSRRHSTADGSGRRRQSIVEAEESDGVSLKSGGEMGERTGIQRRLSSEIEEPDGRTRSSVDKRRKSKARRKKVEEQTEEEQDGEEWKTPRQGRRRSFTVEGDEVQKSLKSTGSTEDILEEEKERSFSIGSFLGIGGKKKKEKKGPKKSLGRVSGNIAFDPSIYDLTTLTVMNLPEGLDEAKLKRVFPGSTIKMEGDGGASVMFDDAALAEPYFTKEISLNGQSLVISPKLFGA